MRSGEYRDIIRRITKRTLIKRFPGLNKKFVDEAANNIAINIHARMYGANVDNVESPIWRKDEPEIDAKELLS